eukprot:13430414-Alexandrium_andersonii.AAC.1
MSASALESVQADYKVFLHFWRSAGGHFFPKHHMGWHMVNRAATDGNPRYYHTYPDEGENRRM